MLAWMGGARKRKQRSVVEEWRRKHRVTFSDMEEVKHKNEAQGSNTDVRGTVVDAICSNVSRPDNDNHKGVHQVHQGTEVQDEYFESKKYFQGPASPAAEKNVLKNKQRDLERETILGLGSRQCCKGNQQPDLQKSLDLLMLDPGAWHPGRTFNSSSSAHQLHHCVHSNELLVSRRIHDVVSSLPSNCPIKLLAENKTMMENVNSSTASATKTVSNDNQVPFVNVIPAPIIPISIPQAAVEAAYGDIECKQAAAAAAAAAQGSIDLTIACPVFSADYQADFGERKMLQRQVSAHSPSVLCSNSLSPKNNKVSLDVNNVTHLALKQRLSICRPFEHSQQKPVVACCAVNMTSSDNSDTIMEAISVDNQMYGFKTAGTEDYDDENNVSLGLCYHLPSSSMDRSKVQEAVVLSSSSKEAAPLILSAASTAAPLLSAASTAHCHSTDCSWYNLVRKIKELGHSEVATSTTSELGPGTTTVGHHQGDEREVSFVHMMKGRNMNSSADDEATAVPPSSSSFLICPCVVDEASAKYDVLEFHTNSSSMGETERQQLVCTPQPSVQPAAPMTTSEIIYGVDAVDAAVQTHQRQQQVQLVQQHPRSNVTEIENFPIASYQNNRNSKELQTELSSGVHSHVLTRVKYNDDFFDVMKILG